MVNKVELGLLITIISIIFIAGFLVYYEKVNELEIHNVDETNKWMLYRDLFTPMNNDTVTIENAGYDNGWLFWVNHSRVLDSFYFPDQQNYLIKINSLDGDIEILE